MEEEEGIIDEATDKQHVEPKRVVGGGGVFWGGGAEDRGSGEEQPGGQEEMDLSSRSIESEASLCALTFWDRAANIPWC